MPIRAVLFDLGGVVFDSPFDGIAAYERSAGLPAGLVVGLNATDPDTNAWARYERGDVDLDGFSDLFEAEARAIGHEVSGRAVIAALDTDTRPAALTALARLRDAGLRTAAVTNNVAPLDRRRPQIAELIERFDVIVESSIERVRKPEPAFYELVLARLGVPAGECAFLDDLGVNLKTARAMGMTTIKVIELDDALRELSRVTGVELAT